MKRIVLFLMLLMMVGSVSALGFSNTILMDGGTIDVEFNYEFDGATDTLSMDVTGASQNLDLNKYYVNVVNIKTEIITPISIESTTSSFIGSEEIKLDEVIEEINYQVLVFGVEDEVVFYHFDIDTLSCGLDAHCTEDRICHLGTCSYICYIDNDGDGYGAVEIAKPSCEGYATKDGDCDDTDKTFTNEGTREISCVGEERCRGTLLQTCTEEDGLQDDEEGCVCVDDQEEELPEEPVVEEDKPEPVKEVLPEQTQENILGETTKSLAVIEASSEKISPLVNIPDFQAQREFAKEILDVKKTLTIKRDGDDVTSTVTITITSDVETDVRIIEDISKQFAEHSNDLHFTHSPLVLEADPVIMWHLKDFSGEESITYSVDKNVTVTGNTILLAETIQEVDVEGEGVDKKKLFPLLIIPIVAVVIWFFARSKKE